MSLCRVLSRMSELDRELTVQQLSTHIGPLVTGLLCCMERLDETKRSSLGDDDEMDIVDHLTRCEASITVECRRLLCATGCHVTADCSVGSHTLVANLMAATD